jgi:hypothetical protein
LVVAIVTGIYGYMKGIEKGREKERKRRNHAAEVMREEIKKLRKVIFFHESDEAYRKSYEEAKRSGTI